MVTTIQSQLLERLRTLMTTAFKSPGSLQNEPDTRKLLEDPLFKQYIFPNNVVAVIDHAAFGYRYVSESSREIYGVTPEDFLKKGIAFTMSLINEEDLLVLATVMEEGAAIVQSLPPEDRIFMRFNYSLRYNMPLGYKVIYQQTLPLAFNDLGVPYLVLAINSDITAYTRSQAMIYSLLLNRPGELPKTLLSNHASLEVSPLTDREKEIVVCLAEGMNAGDIAEKLFISEDTVRTHRRNILGKTGARNSVHLVRIAVANGWI